MTASVGQSRVTDYTFLRMEHVDDGVVVVTLDRPPVNAVSQDMYAEIRDLFGRFDEVLPGVRAVVLTGSGRHFCADNDLVEFGTLTPQNSAGRMKLVRESLSAIYDCPVPVIAAVRGPALGTGTAIAGSCDVVICGESAKFGTPEVGVRGHGRWQASRQVGAGADHAADVLHRRSGPAAALMAHGGIAEIVPDDGLHDAALALARRMTRHSQAALRQAKESLNMVEFMDLKSGYEAEQRMTLRLSGEPDSQEARQAILDKRAPRYAGR